MYCGQCGKKVMENMLFCPFCGSPIVIPDQDEAAPVQNVPEAAPAHTEAKEAPVIVKAQVVPSEEPARPEPVQTEPARPVSLFEAFEAEQAGEDVFETPKPAVQQRPQPEPCRAEAETEAPVRKEDFIPLSFDFGEYGEDAPEPEVKAQPASPRTEELFFDDMPSADDIVKPVPDTLDEAPGPARRPEPPVYRQAGGQKRSVNTYIPVKDIDPDDIFMDGGDDDDYDDDYDDYDDYDDRYDDDYRAKGPAERVRYRDDDFDFEEPEHGSFFQRHIRGIVGLILLVVLLAICAIWACSPKGQMFLAKLNLAWTAKPYADLGYEAYLNDQDELAARYYAKAFAKDDDNYEYAHSAMVAYYEAYDIDSSAAMLKKCIELQPDNPEPYIEMLTLYPDPETRPWEIKELLRLGYQRTGHESLNQP